MLGPADLPEPLIDVKFDANGSPYVKLLPMANTEGVEVTVRATEDLSDWSNATVYPVEPATGICDPGFDTVPPEMFFMYRIHISGE